MEAKVVLAAPPLLSYCQVAQEVACRLREGLPELSQKEPPRRRPVRAALLQGGPARAPQAARGLQACGVEAPLLELEAKGEPGLLEELQKAACPLGSLLFLGPLSAFLVPGGLRAAVALATPDHRQEGYRGISELLEVPELCGLSRPLVGSEVVCVDLLVPQAREGQGPGPGGPRCGSS